VRNETKVPYVRINTATPPPGPCEQGFLPENIACLSV
jgi:hypothetical protein